MTEMSQEGINEAVAVHSKILVWKLYEGKLLQCEDSKTPLNIQI